MSKYGLVRIATPGTPAVNEADIFLDTDDRRIKAIDDNGVISTLSNERIDRNFIYNGDLAVQQRVATAATNIAGVSLTTRAGVVADRWAVTVGNVTTPQWTQVNAGTTVETGLSAKYYGRITQLTNAAKFIFSQVLANEDIACLRGEKVRFSVKLKQFAGSNAGYRLGLLQLNSSGVADTIPAITSALNGASTDPTWGTNLVAIAPDASPTAENGTIDGNAVDVTSTANWVRSSAVFTIPATALNLILVVFRDTIGAASDSVGIAECQLTMGPDIVEWTAPDPAAELARCQRYFYKTFSYPTVPATNLGITTGIVKWNVGVAGAVAGTWGFFQFVVPMWKVPTITLFNPAAANAQARQISATAGDCATSSGSEITTRGCAVTCTPGASAVIGSVLGVHFTAEAEFIT